MYARARLRGDSPEQELQEGGIEPLLAITETGRLPAIQDRADRLPHRGPSDPVVHFYW